MENYQEDSITPLLDTEAGDWSSEGINYSREMYEIALKCLEEKRKRPNMVQIRDMLNCVASTLFVWCLDIISVFIIVLYLDVLM